MPTLAQHYPAVRRAVTDLRDVHDDLGERSRRLGRSFEDFLDSGWRGAAAASYDQGWREWRRGVRDVLDALGVLADLVETTSADLDRTDARGALDLHRLDERLGGAR